MKKKGYLDQETKNRVKKLTLNILLILFLLGGFSYAFVSLSYSSDKVDTIQSKCFDIRMEDDGNIIVAGIPISDELAVSQKAYNYTVTNTCDLTAYYETTVNVLSPSVSSDASKVRVALYGDSMLTPSTLSTLQQSDLTTTYSNPLENVLSSYQIDAGYIPAHKTRTYKLLMWVNNNAVEFNNEFFTQLLITAISKDGQSFTNSTSGNDVLKNNTVLYDYDYSKVNGNGLYFIKRKNDEHSYYFRGNVVNNYVSFADKTWRIVKINVDGSIKLVLDDVIGTSSYGSVASFDGSSIKSIINTWYENNLSLNDKYIKNETFCNDVGTYTNNEITYYNSYKRVVTDLKPELKCSQKYLSKIGLLSADEVMYAGASYDVVNESTYLYNSNESWTMSPAFGSLNVFTYGGLKSLQSKASTETLYIRPSITLNKNTILSGDGTIDNKYQVNGLYTDLPFAYNDSVAPTIVYARTTNENTGSKKSIYLSAKDNEFSSGIDSYIITTTNVTPASNDSNWVSMSSNSAKTAEFSSGTYYVWVKDKSNNISLPSQIDIVAD